MSMLRRSLLKVIVLGDSGVGKTSLMNQYVNNKFSQQYKATIGADFVTKELQIDDRLVTLQVCFFSCLLICFCLFYMCMCVCFRYGILLDKRGSRVLVLLSIEVQIVVCLFMMLTTSSHLILSTIGTRSFLSSPRDPTAFPFILLGNKIDIDGGNSRVVSEKKAREWCAQKGNICYYETSAKEDYNVDESFLCITKLALANERDQDIYFQGIPESGSEPEQRGGCAC